MTNTVLLTDEEHHDLAVAPRFGAAYGDAVNIVRLFPTEFIEAQREFPILFHRDEAEGWYAFALTGLAKGENLYLHDDQWTSRFIPAAQRRGPFSIGVSQPNGAPSEANVQIDLDDARVGAVDGLRLFTENGGNAPYLDYVSEALRAIHDGLAATKPMFDAFERASLLEPVTVEIKLTADRQYTLQDYHTISVERLRSLDGETLSALAAAGFLDLAYAAVFSLSNINRLIEEWNRRHDQADED